MKKYKLALVYADIVLATAEISTLGNINGDILKCRAVEIVSEENKK